MNPLARRIVAALGANSFGQATVIFMQLAALPLFLGRWDTTTYGTWLMLTAIPAYLSMTDGGLVLAAANKATMEVAQGNLTAANRTFQSAFAFLLFTATTVAAAALALIYLAGIPGNDTQDRQHALSLLVIGVLAAQFNGLAESVFRATNRYAQGIILGNISRLLEFFGWTIGLYVSGTFTGVALSGLIFRLAGLTLCVTLSRKNNSALTWSLSEFSKEECRSLVKPGVSFMAFPLSNAMSIQGVTLIVGHTVGPAAVTIFNTYRTLTRVALQVTTVLGNSLWVEFSKLFAMGKFSELELFYRRALKAGMATSFTVCVGVYFTAPTIISTWTHGEIAYDDALLLVLLGCALAGGVWNVPRVLLMSINSHGPLSTQAIAGAALTVSLSAALTSHFGFYGAASGVLAVEMALAAASMWTAHKMLSNLKITR